MSAVNQAGWRPEMGSAASTDQATSSGDKALMLARGMPLVEMLPPGLTAHLRAAAADAPVLFETPLGRAVADHSALIGWSVWLDLPADIALARKIAATVGQADVTVTDWRTM